MSKSNRSWSVLVGSRRGGDRGKISPKDDRALQRVSAEFFPDGYTIIHSSGGWFDPKARRFIREESRQIIVCSSKVSDVIRWAKALGVALNQKEMLLVEHGRARMIPV